MQGLHRIRTISGGKSAGFGHTGKARGRTHQPGEEILGQKISHAESIITLDDKIVADVFISDIDEAMSNYEVRGEYSKQCGEALGRIFDKQAMRVAVQAARSSNKITGLPGGTTITLSAGYAAAARSAQAVELAAALRTAVQNFQESDVDADGAVVLLRPAEYWLLLENKDLLNRDWGGMGSYATGELPMVAGLPLIVTNHLPNQDDSTTLSGGEYFDGIDIINAKYVGDYSKLKAVIFKPGALGTVQLQGIGIDGEWDHRRRGELIIGEMLVGHGVLRPEEAQEIVLP